MEQVCPLCNGLREPNVKCPKCRSRMEDAGMITDYVGPYSPYELTPKMKQENHGLCTHVMHCPNCMNVTYMIAQSDVF